jgi:hypothetical protein
MNLERAGEGLTHDDFKKRLRDSEPVRLLVAGLLDALGAREVRVPPQRIAPTYEDRGSYIDNGDLYARFRPGGTWHRFEAKGLSVDFTGVDDWPFGGTIFVDEKDGWERKDPKPKGYFSVNRAMTVAIYLPCSNPSRWYVKNAYDSHYKTYTDFYATTIDCCTAYDLLGVGASVDPDEGIDFWPPGKQAP